MYNVHAEGSHLPMRVCLEGNALRSFGSISLSSLTGIVQASSDDREPYR